MTNLAVCLTVYGRGLMNLRWLALFAFFTATSFCWISARHRKSFPSGKNDSMVIATYLVATFLSVVAAENPLFSGLRWASHALMLIALLVLLKSSLSPGTAMAILLFLKAVIAGLLLVSWLNPLPPVALKISELYRGAFGNSNALGQVAAIGALLYIHGFLTDKPKWLRIGQAGMSCLALWIVWLSGARSALVAFLTGLTLMYCLYPKLMRARVFWIGVLLTSLIIAFPSLPLKVKQVLLRTDEPTQSISEQLLITRRSVWTAAWEGFQKRPLLGWGFGADDSISKQWDVQLTSIGTVTRDAINDVLIILESSGVVGLGAYCLLVFYALKQIPTRRERQLLSRIHSPPASFKGLDFSQYHLHAITFVLSASLLLMVQFDNTALSAGNFISATLWLCVGLTATMRARAMADEFSYQRHTHDSHWPFDSQLVAMSSHTRENEEGIERAPSSQFRGSCSRTILPILANCGLMRWLLLAGNIIALDRN